MLRRVVLSRATIPEDDILHSYRHENLNSYIALTGWYLQRKCNGSPVNYELGFIFQKTTFLIVTAVSSSNSINWLDSVAKM
jgi:hypothetical protein